MKTHMHYYGIYILARLAELKHETAEIMATASQCVDEAMDKDRHLVLRELFPEHKLMVL